MPSRVCFGLIGTGVAPVIEPLVAEGSKGRLYDREGLGGCFGMGIPVSEWRASPCYIEFGFLLMESLWLRRPSAGGTSRPEQ